MVAEEGSAPSPLRREGEANAFIPLRFLAICGNDDAYDVSRYSACPNCGNFDRIMVGKVLSPEIFGKRIRAALAAMKVR
jgi:hypothetical protein